MMKKEWEIIHDMDDDNGNPTCWCIELNHEMYGRYIWITEVDIKEFVVEYCCTRDEFRTLAECKSLASAKRWVSMNLV